MKEVRLQIPACTFVIFIAVMLLTSNFSRSTEILYQTQYTIRDGLPDNSVRKIFKDRNGMLWLGTNNGLARWDGRSFRIFKNDPTDSTTISNNLIFGIDQDKDGFLWVATNNGLNKFDPSKQSFRRFSFNDTLGLEKNMIVNSLHIDDRGHIWAGILNAGLIKLNKQGYLMAFYQANEGDNESIAQNNILHIQSAPEGNLLLGLGGYGLSIWDKEAERSKNIYFGRDLEESTFRANVIRDILQTDTNTIWMTSYNGLHSFNLETFQYSHYTFESTGGALPENSLHSLISDENGGFWMATYGGGVVHFNPATEFFTPLATKSNPSNKNISVFDILYTDDFLWAATAKEGLIKFGLLPPEFLTITSSDFDLPVNTTPSAHTYDKDGNIWISFKHSGIHKLKMHADGSIQKIDFRNQKPIQSRLSDVAIRKMLFDEKGFLWIATQRNGVYALDTLSGELEHFTFGYGDQNITHMSVHDLEKGQDGNIWISTSFGLNRWNGNKKIIEKFFTSDSNDPFRPKSPNIGRLYLDNKDRLWILSKEDLIIYDNDRFTSLQLMQEKDQSVGYISIYQDHHNRIWLGTTFGLIQLNEKEDGTFETVRFNQVANLNNLRINGISSTRDGMLLFTTQLGLYQFDPDRNILSYINSGLSPKLPYISKIAELPGKEAFMFTSRNSFYIYHPSEEEPESNISGTTFFTRIRINNEDFSPGILSQNKQDSLFILPFGNHILSFEFVFPDFLYPERVSYLYRIPELSAEWIDLGNQNRISLAGLSPGSYNLQLKSFAMGSIPSAVNSFQFKIKQPYWQKWWFYLLVTLVFFTIVWAVFRYDTKRRLEVERLRNKIARDLHDDIGSTLTKISIFAELSLSGQNPEQKKNHLQKIAALGRDAVASIGEIVWTTDARNDKMGNLFNKIQDYALDILSQKDIAFDFSATAIDPDLPVSAQIRQHLYLISKEAINNMVKHSNGNKLNIHFSKKGSKISLHIYDNGNVEKDILNKISGNGINNIRNRTASLKGQIEISIHDGFRILIKDIQLHHGKIKHHIG